MDISTELAVEEELLRVRCAIVTALQPNAENRRELVRMAEKEVTPTDRLSRAGTCLAACSCPFERFPRGRYED